MLTLKHHKEDLVEPEELEIITEGTDWIKFDIQGKWFPDAFIGVMANMQRFKNGEDNKLITSIDDSVHTMAVVDSCGISSQSGGLKINYAD